MSNFRIDEFEDNDDLIPKNKAMKKLGIRSYTTMNKYIQQGLFTAIIVPWSRGPMLRLGEIKQYIKEHEVKV